MNIIYCCSYCNSEFQDEATCKYHESLHEQRVKWEKEHNYQKVKTCSRCRHCTSNKCSVMEKQGINDNKVRPDYFCDLFTEKPTRNENEF